MGKKTIDQGTLLPMRASRAEAFARIRALPQSEQLEAILQMRKERIEHPDAIAKRRIEDALVQAHLHADLKASPELSKLVFLFREIIHDFVPGETIDEALEPLHAKLSQQGGGRPKAEAAYEQWRERYEELKRTRPMLSAPERYDDIAAEWAAEGHAPVKWTQIRDGISELKNRRK